MIGRLHALYARKGISNEQKEAMLLDLTDGRTSHTNELSYKEAIYLWGYLNGSFGFIEAFYGQRINETSPFRMPKNDAKDRGRYNGLEADQCLLHATDYCRKTFFRYLF